MARPHRALELTRGNHKETPMRAGADQYLKATVASADGTTIGYRKLGRGPGLVLLHGGVNASQHMMKLGAALADAYTIYLPDRRGRGMSGPMGPQYSIEREDEDLAAVVNHTGAEFVFGPADGGLFALHGAIGLGRVRKVAAYEPLLLLGNEDDDVIRRVFTTMQDLIRAGRGGEAVLFSTVDVATRASRDGHFPAWLAAVLRHLPVRATGRLIDAFFRLAPARGDTVSWRQLIAALPPELDLVLATQGTLDEYRRLEAEVLLMYGSKTDRMFVTTAAELHRVLPHSTVVQQPGLNHDSAQTYGKPAAIAAGLRQFFGA
jgi:pimeloyl-ACP methyl ester carboxylesterase